MDKALALLREYFGYTNFRAGQELIIKNILNNKNVLGIMTTGAGKSICYQIPALMFDGLTIVVSPLISLMKDQVDELKMINISAEYLNSSLTKNEYISILKKILANQVKILYISPERFENVFFRKFLNQIKISMIVVDEAHCISQWGEDFRKSYLKIADVIQEISKNNKIITLALTATATPEIKLDIVEKLRLKDPIVFTDEFNRENIFFEVLHIDEEKFISKEAYIKNFLKQHRNEAGIIYCSTRKKVEDLFIYINNIFKIPAIKYHAGLSSEEREKNQEIFLRDEVKIMVATNAFGMGINKPNIRYVIHFNLPRDIESYFQEAGRAGRDGGEAKAILIFDPKDISLQKYFISMDINSSDELKLQKYKKLEEMVNYCETNNCLREYILKYFGDKLIRSYCAKCSNCKKEKNIKDFSIEAKKVISCIGRAKENIGVSTLINILLGKDDAKILRKGLNKLSTFGIMRDVDTNFLENFINYMLNEKYIYQSAGSYPVVKLGKHYKDILEDKIKIIRKVDEQIHRNYFENDLYKLLINLREELAIKNNVRPYIIFSDMTIVEMAEKKPKNRFEMLKIQGIGNQKFLNYGMTFLDKINEYENNKKR